MNIRIFIIPIVIATLGACSSNPPKPNVALNEAQRQLSAAESNATVTSLAVTELDQAQKAMQIAKTSWENKEDEAKVNHLAYMASQRVKIAQDTASIVGAHAISTNAGAQRDKLLLRERSKEASQAEERTRIAAGALAEAKMKASENARQHEKRVSELESELKILNARQTERGMVITLGDVLFKTSQSEISSNSALTISKLADFLIRYPLQRVSIEGHTDNTGTESGNYALSQERANAVQTALLNRGVDRNQLSTQAFGQGRPIADNATAAGRQMNRRVDIVFEQKGDALSSSK